VLRWLSLLVALSGAVSAAQVNLAWDPALDSRLTGYELGWGSAAGAYSQYQQTVGTSHTLDLAEPGPWYIAARSLGQDAGAPIRSAWSNEVVWYADVSEQTQPLAQVGLWARYESEDQIVAIPASVTFYTNWVHGTLVSTTYTQATPEIPNAHTWTFVGSIAPEPDTPWNGQTLADFTAAWNHYATATVSSSTVPASAGRLLIEVDTMVDNHRILNLSATSPSNGLLRIERTAGNLSVSLLWNNYNNGATVDLGTFPTSPFALEIIYDTLNSTRAERCKARLWTIGGTPPSSFTAATTTDGGQSVATDQFVALTLGNPDSDSYVRIGRVIVSNSITEDLSAVTETAAAASALPRRALDGPFYGALRGSVR